MRQRTRTALGSLAAAVMLSFVPVSGAMADMYWQCVPFARLISGIQIFGDARTWWDQASGKYEKGQTPKAGSVLCFKPTGRMTLGHVAVVSQVLTDRVIQITHANWSRIGGTRGQVEKDVTVIDVSEGGDWSKVKVWYESAGDLGSTTYPTYGFIYQDRDAQLMAASGSKVAYAQNAALSVAQSAANQVVGAVRPGASPLQMLGQAADGADAIATLIQQATSGGSN
ncbi:MAG TPA: CHAP domain-containing protein [Caulobacteraceae bacterium]